MRNNDHGFSRACPSGNHMIDAIPEKEEIIDEHADYILSLKQEIDRLDYTEMLSRWFFDDPKDGLLQDEVKEYFVKTMQRKHAEMHGKVSI